MELTNELLYQFRALYWGQNVLCSWYFDWDNHPINIRTITVMNGNIYMSLRPLSSITEEELTKIMIQLEVGQNRAQHLVETINWLYASCRNETRHWLIDYLRSKGFLLPFMGIPSDQWVEWGVVKLKE